jgi:4-alpha-glucanotransferase
MDLNQRASGVLLHPTSLPGPFGIGDLGPSALHFIDWLERAGQTLWQWLPTTPIGPGDSPYQSVSAFAGSPLMVALEPLIEAGWLTTPALAGFSDTRVDFAKVVPWRLARLREAFAGFEAQATAAQRDALAAWAEQEAYWLDDYSLFMALESAHGGACWWDWVPELRSRKKAALTKARKEHAAEIAFWVFVQWQFDTQLSAIKRIANAKGIHLVGDLPIFIAHHSADCWAAPEFYYLDENFQPTVVAGVPPDDLGPQGQRWGNPLYRWDKMKRSGYKWWTDRVRRALAQADVFRIDHFRGFAGYYEIPASCPTAMEGEWVKGPGKGLFDAIAAELGDLPIIAEDLGLITPDVIELRDACGYPGMKILQFAFGAEGDHEFLPQSYVRECVVYTGTHDNDTAKGWWHNAKPRERAFAGAYLACGDHDVHWAMIRAASNSVANLAIFPLQDVLGLGSETRMNTPGTLGGSNWTWRFTWDQIGPEPGRVLGLLSAASGRGPFALLGLPA